MVKRLFILLVLAGLVRLLLPLIHIPETDSLHPLGRAYAEGGPGDLSTANLVTSIVVTYRGLDTLGEVAVLFIATAGVGFMLRRRHDDPPADPLKAPSEILNTGARLLMPLIVLFGAYIVLHGHLTPGGGFQGGVVMASAIVLFLLSHGAPRVSHGLISAVESLSGGFYVGIGVLGLILAGGFLDPRFLPLGETGRLISGGAIPLIYGLIGLKVGSELVGILDSMQRRHS